MFDQLKKIFDLGNQPINEWQFYPLMNTEYNVEQLSRTDYLKLYKGWVYVATNTIADNIASLEYNTFNGDEEQGHPYNDLIDYQFLKKVASYMLLNGNCFVYKEMIWNKVDELAILRPDLVKLEQYADWSLKGYRYNGHGKNILYDPEEIINFSMFSPWETYPWIAKGVSPVEAVAIQAEMDNTANKWNWNFFKNGASVKDILKSDSSISKEAQKRFVDKWKSEFQGVNNSNKVAFLDKWVNYESIGAKQKELDFVESRRFTRDEILSIFKVPKTIIGISDDVNLASAQMAERTYYKACIWPLAKQISNRLNSDLYNDVEFRFLNVVPEDTEKVRQAFNDGAITMNEYREALGYDKVENGDVNKLNEDMLRDADVTEEEVQENQYSDIVKKTIRKNSVWSKERKEQLWYDFVKRTKQYETSWENEIKEVFEMQKREIVYNITKGYKQVDKPEFNITKYKAIWRSALRPLYEEVMRNEWTEANNLVGINEMFEIWSPRVNDFLRQNIDKVATDIDNYTKEKVFDVIEQGNEEWLGVNQIRTNISREFEDMKKDRAERIARTEITRASNTASEMAYKDGGVEVKEWLAELDWRTSDICQNLNGTKVAIGDNFANKGDSVAGAVLDYEDVWAPPAHPNCRSTLIPVL